jgi:hypothetical protein
MNGRFQVVTAACMKIVFWVVVDWWKLTGLLEVLTASIVKAMLHPWETIVYMGG